VAANVLPSPNAMPILLYLRNRTLDAAKLQVNLYTLMMEKQPAQQGIGLLLHLRQWLYSRTAWI